jgi:hypothetical protein
LQRYTESISTTRIKNLKTPRDLETPLHQF